MRRIITYIAVSADGYIARADGSVEWLNRPRPRDNYGMGAFLRGIDTVVWGRKTWRGQGFGPGIANLVFSRRTPPGVRGQAEFLDQPVAQFARDLRRRNGKNIWIMGGAGIIASFLDAQEVDEFIIHVVPVFIGEGLPLLTPRHRLVPLTLRSSRRYADGVVRLHYARVTFHQTETRSGQVARTDIRTMQMWRREPDGVWRIARTVSFPEPVP